MIDVSIYMVFLAGLISFISPCVLPLVPGYISFVSGVSLKQFETQGWDGKFQSKEKALILLNSILFIFGFTVIFVLLGASATWIGSFFTSRLNIFTKIAGLFIIFFGLFKMGLIRSLFFYREAKFHIKDRRFGLLGAFIIGASFAFGWTPCIGPILGAILTYSATLETVNRGILLLIIYSMGLGIPFLLAAVCINGCYRLLDRIKKHLGLIEKISGGIMVLFGLLIFFNKLVLIPAYLSFLNRFAF